MKIKMKLLSVILAPVLLTAFFVSRGILNAENQQVEARHIVEMGKLAVKIGDLIHELQKERGMSAGYLGSSGQKFGDELKAQQQLVDKKFLSLEDYITATGKENFVKEIQFALNNSSTEIKQLQNDFRSKVLAQDCTSQEAVAYITAINEGYHISIATMAHLSSNTEVSNEILAFFNFLEAQELAGIERALVTAVLSKGNMTLNDYKKISELISKQETYLDSFSKVASEPMKEALKKALTAPAIQQVQDVRTHLFDINISGKKFTQDPNKWFETITKKINILKTVEGKLGEIIIARSVSDNKLAATQSWPLYAIALLCLIISCIVVIISLKISQSIKGISEESEHLSLGDFTSQTPTLKSKDEIGDLSRSINNSINNLSKMIKSVKGNSDDVKGISQTLKDVIESLNEQSENLDNQSGNVASVAEELNANVSSMAGAIEELSVNSQSVSSSAEEMSVNMATVSSAVEEMSTSIENVATNARGAKETAEEAQDISRKASQKMTVLNDASKEIGKVTEVIKRIAEQTNLLALNATIEAASAGEAGKGFAVVANEIKELAGQSAKAAEDIAEKINGVQQNSTETLDAISAVNEIIINISSAVQEISGTVDQQSSAAGEIASNVSEASKGVNEISNSISEIAKGTTEMSSNASEISQGTSEVSENITEVNAISSSNKREVQKIEAETQLLVSTSDTLNGLIAEFKIA